MAKKEAPQIEAKPENENMSDDFPKFYKEVSDEIVHLTEKIKDEIQWLEQHCQKLIEECKSEWYLGSLLELRKILENTRNELRRQSYSLSYGSDYTKYLYGEIGGDELRFKSY
jgi:hypothetical protein